MSVLEFSKEEKDVVARNIKLYSCYVYSILKQDFV